jgi:hypothetical protein
MNNEIKSEKYRRLSIAALVTGILAFAPIFISTQLIDIMARFIPFFMSNVIVLLFAILGFVLYGLPIAAIVCGSIDLKGIKQGRYNNKGKGIDITGIVLGGIFIFSGLVFTLLEEIFPYL